MNKKLFSICLLTVIAFTACKNGEEKTTNEATTESAELSQPKDILWSGEYFYSDDGAVLKGRNFIYAVTLDDMAKELADQVTPVKKEEYDMVPVLVKGIVERNPALDEGKEVWEQIITITEIVSVGDAPAEVDIKIEDTKEEEKS